MCALRFTYLDDPDLFVCWYRNFFLADPAAWTLFSGVSTPNDDALMDFLVRMTIVLADFPDNSAIIAKYWSEKAVSALGIKTVVLDEFDDAVAAVLSKSTMFRNWVAKAKKRVDELTSTADFDVSSARKLSLEMAGYLDEGRVSRYDTRQRQVDKTRFLFVQSLFHAYLSLLKQQCGNKDVLLKRDSEGEPLFDPQRDAQIMFDRRGGTFVPEEPMMSWYFRARCAFIMGLWDMSTKEKAYIPLLREILQM